MNKKKKILAALFVFVFAFLLRLWNLNSMGRTWDETAYVEVGNKMIQLILNKNIFNSYFYHFTDAPPLARYLFGIASNLDIKSIIGGIPVFNYEYTYARLISIIFSSFSSVIVLFIGIEFISVFVGIAAAIILAMLPFFLGLSQLATLESTLFFFFTLSVYLYLRFLRKPSKLNVFLTGFAIGLAILSKYTNVLLIPVILGIYFFWNKEIKDKLSKIILKQTLYMFVIAILTFIIAWPMPWANLSYVIGFNYNWRVMGNLQPDIEVFYGRLMHLPVFYYPVMFLITTPLIIVLLFFIGSKFISDYTSKKEIAKKAKESGFVSSKWFLYSLLAWFCIPFIQSFYNYRHHGIRFIIEIYAPLSIIAAIGLNCISSKFSKTLMARILFLFVVIIYLAISLIKLTPYYLDYYNGLVGGTNGVYKNRLFEIGWWGQGLGEAGYYLQNYAKPNSKIGLFISPTSVFPPIKNQKIMLIDPVRGVYDSKIKYDYVVVNYFHVLRERFDDSKIKGDYKLIHTVSADGAVLVYIYQKI